MFVVISLQFTACKKEAGIGGEASISGQIKHHDDVIPNATVYIKYGAMELPGTSPEDYDDKTIASANGANYSFTGLQRGHYYLFAKGDDPACACEVIGGVPIEITEKDQKIDSDVPITE